MTIGEKIKEARKKKRLSQPELAALLGYQSRSSISKIEKGERDIPRSQIVKIAKLLDINPVDLVDLDFSEDEKNVPANEHRDELYRLLKTLTDKELVQVVDYIRFIISQRRSED